MSFPHHSGGIPLSHPRRVATFLALAVGLSLVGAGLGGVSADDPGEPVNIYGTAADEAGTPVPEGTTVYALVDGEVEDSLTVTETGAFGGPDPFDERLVVNTGAGETVTFTVDDPDGPTAFESLDLDEADDVVELNLTFPDETFAESPALAGLSLSLDETTLAVGGTATASATATFDDDTESDVTDAAEFESLDPEIAAVSGTTVTGESPGTATVEATYTVDGETATDIAEVTVEDETDPAVLESVSLALGADTIEVGGTTDATVTATFEDGTETDVTDAATVESLDPEIATVSGASVTGESPGTATVEATYTEDGETATDTAAVSVEEDPDPVVLESVSLALGADTIQVGETTDATVTATFEDGTESDVTDAATVESLDPDVVTVEDGTLVAATTGTATVEATYTEDGVTATDTAELTVEEESDPAVLESVSLALEADTLEVGETTGATVTATFEDGTESDVTDVATVGSLDPEIATVAGATVTGESPGTATVEATYTEDGETATDTAELTVEAAGEATFELGPLDAPEAGTSGDQLDVSVTVTNVGDAAGSVTVTYSFDGTVEDEATVELDPGEETTVSFSAVAPDEDGEFEHAVGAGETTDTATTSVTRDTDENGDGTDENGDGTDENGDGTDENGDGTDENGDGTDENGDETDDGDDGFGPGFGVVAAILALLALGVAARAGGRLER